MAQSFVGPLVLRAFGGRAGAPPAAADQGDLDRVVLAGITADTDRLRRRGPRQRRAGMLQKCSTRSATTVRFLRDVVISQSLIGKEHSGSGVTSYSTLVMPGIAIG